MANQKFAIIVDGEVAATLAIDDEVQSDSLQRVIAAYMSDPKIIHIPNEEQHSGVVFGWTYDGSEFHPPVVD